MSKNEQIPGLPVSGYRAQSAAAVATVNAVKEIEEHVLRLVEEIGDDAELIADKRWLALGRTHIELGFMAVNRAVFKPERVSIPDEDEPIVESGWLLERADSDVAAPLYYAPRQHGDQWSSKDGEAMRFSRKIDALNMALVLAIETRIAEHQWS